MKNINMFSYVTIAQTNYFSQVGRLIAAKNYEEEEWDMPKSSDNDDTVCVIISNSYGEWADLISSVRRGWMISEKNALRPLMKYVIAVKNKVVVAIFQYTEKNPVISSYEGSRKEFTLQIADIAIQQKWLGRRIKGPNLRGREFHYTKLQE